MAERTPGAQRRIERAAQEGRMSISEYRGNLHGHSKEGDESTPEKVVETRQGSNCGSIPLEALAYYHAHVLRNEYVGMTDHSRDANPEEAVNGITPWFYNMYVNDDQWIEETYGKDRSELTIDDLEDIKKRARQQAEQVTYYGDERLQNVSARIDEINNQGQLPMAVLRGVEVNLLPDGSMDTPMVEDGAFELVNTSIHPDLDREGFKDIRTDPEQYTECIVKGIEHPQTNIISHIGFGCEEGFAERLDWDTIAQAAVENNVAIEINLYELTKKLYWDILNFEKFPADDTSYREEFEKAIHDLVPLVSSQNIREKLQPYVERGLKFTINLDEHANPMIQNQTEDQLRNLRYWRCMKMVESYFNEVFDDMGVTKESIINTYSLEELQAFLRKEKVLDS